MEYGDNFLPAAGWTLNNASIANGVLTLQAGGIAQITLANVAGSNLLTESLLLKLTSDVFTDPYNPRAYVEVEITFIDGKTLVTRMPIIEIYTNTCVAVLYTTVATYEGIKISAFDSVTVKFYSDVLMNLSSWTLSQEAASGTAIQEGQLYHGIRITTQNGFEAIRSDNMARAYFNSDTLAFQVGDGSGSNWTNAIYFDAVSGKYIFDGTLSANIINALSVLVTPNFYAGKANIAELTVDMLDTSTKVQKYLDNDHGDVNYIKIYDQYMEFHVASTVNGSEQVENRFGEPLYWIDNTKTSASTTETAWPVMQFTYATDLIKQKFGFDSDGTNNVPMITLGAGDGVAGSRLGRGFIYKSDGGLYIEYVTYGGESRIIKLTESGIDLADFDSITYSEQVVINGLPRIWVQPDQPGNAQSKDVWVDTDNYSRYDVKSVVSTTALLSSDSEMIVATGTISITLHSAAIQGIIKNIFNAGDGVITIIGSINGKSNFLLYPGDSVLLTTDGVGWRF